MKLNNISWWNYSSGYQVSVEWPIHCYYFQAHFEVVEPISILSISQIVLSKTNSN